MLKFGEIKGAKFSVLKSGSVIFFWQISCLDKGCFHIFNFIFQNTNCWRHNSCKLLIYCVPFLMWQMKLDYADIYYNTFIVVLVDHCVHQHRDQLQCEVNMINSAFWKANTSTEEWVKWWFSYLYMEIHDSTFIGA